MNEVTPIATVLRSQPAVNSVRTVAAAPPALSSPTRGAAPAGVASSASPCRRGPPSPSARPPGRGPKRQPGPAGPLLRLGAPAVREQVGSRLGQVTQHERDQDQRRERADD